MMVTKARASEKLPPHDIGAEESIIASALVDPEQIPSLATIVSAEDFFREQNGAIWRAILGLAARDGATAVNRITINHELARLDQLEFIGGPAYTAEVVKTADGVRYRLADGKEFRSPSSAGSEVMGGSACNGWRFWSLEGDLKPKPETPNAVKIAKADLTLKPMKDDPTKFWCSACMDSFPVTEGETPTACPQGHTNAPTEPAPKTPKKATKKAPAKRKVKTKA